MPTCYKFTRNADNVDMNLAIIDQEIRDRLGVPSDEKRYHSLFQLIAMIGLSMTNTPEGHVTEKSFNDCVSRYPDTFDSETECEIARDLLYRKYRYTAWFQH